MNTALNTEIDTQLPSASAITAAQLRSVLHDVVNVVLTTSAYTDDHTLALTDGEIVTMTKSSANNLTVPPNASVALTVGTRYLIKQGGAGATTIVAGSGVTVNALSGSLVINLTGGYATLLKTAADTWDCALGTSRIGDLGAAGAITPATDALEIEQSGVSKKTTPAAVVAAALAATPATVAQGGTGAATLTGLVKGNGAAEMTPATRADFAAAQILGTFAAPITTAPYPLTAANAYGFILHYGATGTIQLPVGAAGMNGLISSTGAFTITIDPNGSEAIVRDGTAQTGGVSVTLSSGAGNFVALWHDGTSWVTGGYKGTLAQGS